MSNIAKNSITDYRSNMTSSYRWRFITSNPGSHNTDVAANHQPSLTGAGYGVTTFLLVMMAVGIIGNFTIIAIYTRKTSHASIRANNFFILMLGWVDLLVCLVIIPCTVADLHLEIEYKIVHCFIGGVRHLGIIFESLTMVGLSLERFLIICRPTSIYTWRQARVIIGGVSVISTVAACPAFFVYTTGTVNQDVQDKYCGISLEANASKMFLTGYFGVMCALWCSGGVVMLVLYALVFRVVLKKRKRDLKAKLAKQEALNLSNAGRNSTTSNHDEETSEDSTEIQLKYIAKRRQERITNGAMDTSAVSRKILPDARTPCISINMLQDNGPSDSPMRSFAITRETSHDQTETKMAYLPTPNNLAPRRFSACPEMFASPSTNSLNSRPRFGSEPCFGSPVTGFRSSPIFEGLRRISHFTGVTLPYQIHSVTMVFASAMLYIIVYIIYWLIMFEIIPNNAVLKHCIFLLAATNALIFFAFNRFVRKDILKLYSNIYRSLFGCAKD